MELKIKRIHNAGDIRSEFVELFVNSQVNLRYFIAVLYGAAVLFAFGNGLMWPSFLSILSKIAGKKYQGSVQGYASSAGSLASIAGLIAGGIIYEQIGAATFLISAGVIGVVFLLSFRIPSVKALAENKAV